MTTDPTPTPDSHPLRESVSALADGALAPQALEAAGAAWADNPEARAAWREYHLIGEVLRDGERAAGVGSEAFARRVAQRIAQEAPQRQDAAPGVASAGHQTSAPARARKVRSPSAANDALWHWRVTALLASFVAVLALGWNLWGLWGEYLREGAALAASPAPMIRDPQLDELLAAHRQAASQRAAQGASRLDGLERVNAAPGNWPLQAAPAGFQPVVCWRRQDTEALRLQCLYSDGQSLVSVLAEPYDRQRHEVFAAAGSGQAQTRRIQDWWVTVVGEVPPHKLQAFARALERQP